MDAASPPTHTHTRTHQQWPHARGLAHHDAFVHRDYAGKTGSPGSCVSSETIGLASRCDSWFTTDSQHKVPLNLRVIHRCFKSAQPRLLVSEWFCWVRNLTEEVWKCAGAAGVQQTSVEHTLVPFSCLDCFNGDMFLVCMNKIKVEWVIPCLFLAYSLL